LSGPARAHHHYAPGATAPSRGRIHLRRLRFAPTCSLLQTGGGPYIPSTYPRSSRAMSNATGRMPESFRHLKLEDARSFHPYGTVGLPLPKQKGDGHPGTSPPPILDHPPELSAPSRWSLSSKAFCNRRNEPRMAFGAERVAVVEAESSLRD